MKPPKDAFAWLVAKDDRMRMEFSDQLTLSLRLNPRRYGILADALREVAAQLDKKVPKLTTQPTPKKIMDMPV